ncbi:methyltransferase str2 [Favolaschia claudopus]|uniref:Methyltransferase str2 n=1 Tax=Favolaschia claudopus TaxID=2862362 RepID=A0AAW0DA09_9AGAR
MSSNPEYVLPVNETEWDRLDAQSNGMDAYLGKLVPEAVTAPKKILEIGAGSGAWAIKVAKQFPDAEVIAADMNPLPERPIPSNLKYEKVNAIEPFPFAAGSFDVVHTRLTLCHLPGGRDEVLPRMIDLVAPGGYLVIDDINWQTNFDKLDNAANIKAALGFIIGSTKALKGDPHFGTGLKTALEGSSKLTDVRVEEIEASLNGPPAGTDARIGTFSRLFRETLTRAVAGAPLTDEAQKTMQKNFLEEMGNDKLEWNYNVGFYFASAKKV